MKRMLSVILTLTVLIFGFGSKINIIYAATDSDDRFIATFTAGSGSIGTATIGLKRGFDFIDKGSSDYNWELALVGVALSAQVYQSAQGDNEEKILYGLGYDTVRNYNGESGYKDPKVQARGKIRQRCLMRLILRLRVMQLQTCRLGWGQPPMAKMYI